MKNDTEITIKLSDSAKDKLPDDFDLNDIGNINLKEAEAIANEDILFLTEDDLIVGLEEFDLIPLKDEDGIAQGEDLNEVDSDTHHVELKDESHIDEKPFINIDVDEMEEKQSPGTNEISENDKHVEGEIFEDGLDGDNIIIDKTEELKNEASKEIDESTSKEKSTDLEPETIINDKAADLDTSKKDDHQIEYENLPEKFEAIGSGKENIHFIDDESVKKTEIIEKELFEETELEKVITDIIDVVEINSIVLKESDKDINEIPDYLIQAVDEYEEEIEEIEESVYRYIDHDIDFISGSIIEDDYATYIKGIDDFYGEEKYKGQSKTIELFGLNNFELDSISDRLFIEDYKDIDIDKEVGSYKMQFRDSDPFLSGDTTCSYFLPVDDSLNDVEKKSIEKDITSKRAFVFEENVEDIKNILGHDIEDFIPEIKEEIIEEGEIGNDEIHVIDEEIFDITDKIVILEDDNDIDRFVQEFPEKKQENLKNLLKYLDGLFEKLPENTIKSFANSEYFDLYVKVLNDMGI